MHHACLEYVLPYAWNPLQGFGTQRCNSSQEKHWQHCSITFARLVHIGDKMSFIRDAGKTKKLVSWSADSGNCFVL